MPFVEHDETLGFTAPAYAPEEKPEPTWGQTFGAAFRAESDVGAAWDLLTRKDDFKPTAGFKVMHRLKELDTERRTSIWDNYRDNFLGVGSEEEMNYVLGRITQEQKDRETLEQAGWAGVVASMAAGTLSPTMLMPFLGPAKGLKGVAQAAGLGALAGAAQEVPLQIAQETRTAGESAFAIGASTVVGGVIGAGASLLRSDQLQKLAAGLERDAGMVAPTTGGAVPSLSAAGAPAEEYAGRLKSAYAMQSAAWLNPVTRVINQTASKTFSWGMSQLADAGLRLEGNLRGIDTATGGTVESRIKTYYGGFSQVVEHLDDNYAKYVFGENNVPGLAPNKRATLAGWMDDTKLSRAEFNAEVSRAVRDAGRHTIPEVSAAAKVVKEQIFDPILKKAQEAGVFGDVTVKGDEEYLTRVYNHEMISARTNEFVETLASEFAQKLNADYGEQLAKLKESGRRTELLVQDLVRPKEEVEAERAAAKQSLKDIDEGRTPALAAGEDQIAALRASARQALKAGDKELRDQLLRDARELEKSFDEELKEVRAKRAEARRRISGLARAAVALEERQLKKLEQIEKIEELMEKNLMRVARKGQTILNRLERYSDKELDADLSNLRSQFADVLERYDAGESRIAKLLENEELSTQKLFGGETEGEFVASNTADAISSLRAKTQKALSPEELRRLDSGYAKSDPELSTDDLRKRATVTFDDAMILYREPGFQSKKLFDEKEYVSASGKPSPQFPDQELPRAEFRVKPGVRGFVVDSGYAGGEVVIAPGAIYKKVGTRVEDGREVVTYEVRPGKEQAAQEKRAGKLSEITDEIEALESVDRFELRAKIQSALDKTIREVTNLVEKRVAREAKLVEAAAKLDPGQVAKRLESIQAKASRRRTEFIGSWQQRADDIDLDKGSADFMAYARQIATEAKDKIMGTNVRIPITDMMQGARGPELARVIDVQSNKIFDFLENDVEKVIRTYLRSLPPDIEIAKKFGSINAQEVFDKAKAELNDRKAALVEKAKEENWSQKKLEKASTQLDQDYAEATRDMEVVIGRLRNTWGLPDNPDGMAYRMGKMVLNLNVLRLMGGTLISSIPDLARPIMKYGLTRALGDGFAPLVTNLKQLKVASREMRYAGAGLDAILHTRAQAIHDVLDDYGRQSKFERGVQYATNKMGQVALFDYWTVAMKQISSSVIIGKLVDSVDIVAGGAKASAKEVAEAQEFLASKGLNQQARGSTKTYAELIFEELNNGKGGTRINGVLMPNTEDWANEEVRQAFRSALASEVDNTIITPGVERPTWMDATMTGRILGQFKSFGMSSTTKVLMAGMQQRDAAFLSGVLASLALGALSYYIHASIAGGDTYEKMKKAGPAKFADEAIARSGVLGIFSEGQRFLERIPAAQKYVSFSGDRTTRRGGDDLLDVLGGPSLGAGQAMAKVMSGLDDPTKSTLHNLRTLMPWQNVLYLRRGFDALENSANLPERRN